MSLDRDDWRALSRILSQYAEMKWRYSYKDEPKCRELLAVWLRDHDMEQEALEVSWGRPSDSRTPTTIKDFRVLIDQASGEVTFARLVWRCYYDDSNFVLVFDRNGGDYQILAGCE